MILKLANNKEYTVVDNCVIENIIILVNNFSEVDTIRSDLTIQNLLNVTLGNKQYNNLPLPQISAVVVNETTIQVNINFNLYSREKMNQEITELQEAVAMLATGGAL